MLTWRPYTMQCHHRMMLRRRRMLWRVTMWWRRWCGCKVTCRSSCMLGLTSAARWNRCRSAVLSSAPRTRSSSASPHSTHGHSRPSEVRLPKSHTAFMTLDSEAIGGEFKVHSAG